MTIVLAGGGLKAGVSAARYAKMGQVVLLHVDFGQPSWPAEQQGITALARSLGCTTVQATVAPDAATCGGRLSTPPPATAAVITVILSIGVQCAMRLGGSKVVVGLSALTDSLSVGLPILEGRPQRTREFTHSYNLMLEALLVQRPAIRVEAPLMDTEYAEVVRAAFHFELPVAKLWTCETAGPDACRQCPPCRARARAFADARRVDPLYVRTAPRGR
ncbi:MAG: 7-cyano-7-deazaguanine synthase [Phycisphaerae bacterium]